jgi:hypothetical protein
VFHAHEVRFILIGGLAGGMWGSPSMTWNLDVGLPVLVAALDDLLRMKKAAGRPQDLVEVEIVSAVKEEHERRS